MSVLVIAEIAVFVAVPVLLIARFVRAENRRTAAFIASLERMSRECPACKPWGGYVLGRMRENGSYETHTCDVCGGTGEAPSRGRA